MGMYQKEGFNRLAKLIALLGFIAAYTVLFITGGRLYLHIIFIAYPVISSLYALGFFVCTRLIYWVIDGFKASKD